MKETPRSHAVGRPSRWWLLVLTVAISAGLSAVWAAAAVLTGSNATWMTLVVAVDASMLLRLAAFPAGLKRALAGLLITAATTLVSAVLVVAAKIGMELGLRPLAALTRLSAEMVPMWLAAKLDPMDLAWLAAGLLLAFVGSR